MIILISLIALILENSLNYYLVLLPSNNINIFLYLKPIFFVSTILIYMITSYKKKNALYYILGISIIYDLMFESIYFLHLTIFFILYLIILFFKSRFYNTKIGDIFIFILLLVMFIIFKYLILLWTTNDYSIMFLVDEISKSLITNIIYGLIIYYILGIKKKTA